MLDEQLMENATSGQTSFPLQQLLDELDEGHGVAR
jgi:hypothetical protein